MSDMHALPLLGHDLPGQKVVRAEVFKQSKGWYWAFSDKEVGRHVIWHGPFMGWDEAYASAHRMVELL